MSADKVGPAFVQCYLANAQSVRNKLTDLQYLLSSLQYDVIAFTETFLSGQDPDSLLLSGVGSDYHLFRSDRACGRGGGVALFCRHRINPVSVSVPNHFSDCECVAVDIHSGSSYRVVCAYRPPAASSADSSLLYQLLESLCQTSLPLVIVGDFNLPLFNWTTYRCPDVIVYSEFSDMISQNALAQKVLQPTRFQNILDLVLCTDELAVSEVCVGPGFGQSDHSAVEFQLLLNICNTLPAERPVPLRDFRRMDVNATRYYCSLIDWQEEFENCANDPGNMWDCFKAKLNQVFDITVPWMNAAHRRKKHPSHLAKLLISKRRLHKKWKRLGTIESQQEYREACHGYSLAVRQYYETREKKILDSRNLSKFYRYVNEKRTVRSGVAPLQCFHGSKAVSDDDKAAELNRQFSSVFTVDNGHLPPFSLRTEATFENYVISSECVRNILCKLDMKYEQDPDELPSAVLRQLSYQLAKPLSMLFTRFLETGFVPISWKTADITPIFKKGSASLAANYRPVSITSAIARVFERVFVENLMHYLRTNGLLSTEQFGFIKRRSAELLLLTCVDSWSRALDNGAFADLVLLDYAKAFDSVSHSKLLHKLEHGYGISGNVIIWIKAFLTGRMQRVKVGSIYSEYNAVASGVPQGTVSGPVLFLLYVNELEEVLSPSVSAKKFADDIQLFLLYRHVQERSVLQKSLGYVSNWSNDWQLRIQPSKCAAITFGNCSEHASYSIEEHVISRVDSVTNLGVIIDKNLSFREHVEMATRKAHRSLAVLFKCFLTNDKCALLRGYVSYVRPVLEYACTVWNPTLHCRSSLSCLTSIDKIESVQRLFTRRLFYRCRLAQMSYTQRLKVLNLEPLELRRLKFSLCTVYKILYGLVDLPFSELFEYCQYSATRGHDKKLRCPKFTKDLRRNGFAISIVPVWNDLPQALVSSVSLTTFKKNLHTYDELLMKYCVFNRNLS